MNEEQDKTYYAGVYKQPKPKHLLTLDIMFLGWIVLALLVLFFSGIAEAATEGCYVSNQEYDECASDAEIKCGSVPRKNQAEKRRQYTHNLHKYGAVVADMCSELAWMSEQAMNDGTTIQKLKNEIERLKQ